MAASSFLKEVGQALEDAWFFGGDFSGYKGITNPLERQQTLVYLERPGWKDGSYKTARRLRKEWGLSLEPDTQTAITRFFVDLNTSHWENVGRGQEQILDFLQSGVAKDFLKEVVYNLHRQWDQGIPIDKELIGGRSDVQTTLAWHGLWIPPDIKEMVGITEDQPVEEQIARLLDPYFEQSKALEIGMQLCEKQLISIEKGVSWGVKWGFIKRNTIDFVRIRDLTQREEILTWLSDDARVDEALRRLTGNLELSYLVIEAKKLC